MNLDMSPKDERAFAAASRTLLEGFRAWCDEKGQEADPSVAEFVLHCKWGSLGRRHLGRWGTADLEEILLGMFPAKVVWEGDAVGEVTSSAGAFLCYLAESGRLHSSSDPLDQMLDALERIAKEMPAAMAGGSGFGMAKLVGLGMLQDGVDPRDERAVGEWLEEHDAGQPLPSRERVAEAAASAPAITSLRLTLEFVGSGRKLVEGVPSLADRRALTRRLLKKLANPGDPHHAALVAAAKCWPPYVDGELLLVWALASDLLEVRGSRLLVAQDMPAPSDPIELWDRAFTGLLVMGVEGEDPDSSRTTLVRNGMLSLLAELDGAPGPVPAGDLVRAAWKECGHRGGVGRQFAADLEDQVARHTGLGSLVGERGGLMLSAPARLRLRLLAQEGAPDPEQAIGLEALELLEMCAHMDMDEATNILAAWCGARDPKKAAEEIADAVRRGGVEARVLAIAAFDVIGHEAEQAVRSLTSHLAFRPFALTWLVERQLEDESSLSPRDSARLMADMLQLSLDTGGPDELFDALDRLGPPEEQAEAIRQIAQASPGGAGEILQAVAAEHPSPLVASAARRALAQHVGRGRSGRSHQRAGGRRNGRR